MICKKLKKSKVIVKSDPLSSIKFDRFINWSIYISSRIQHYLDHQKHNMLYKVPKINIKLKCINTSVKQKIRPVFNFKLHIINIQNMNTTVINLKRMALITPL